MKSLSITINNRYNNILAARNINVLFIITRSPIYVPVILVYIKLISILIRIINNILNILFTRIPTLYLTTGINTIRYKLSRSIYNKL